MSLLKCLAKAWESFWEELEAERSKKNIEIWRCEKCFQTIHFIPSQIWVGGYGPRQGWAVVKIFRSLPETTSGKKIEYKLCPKCVEKLDL